MLSKDACLIGAEMPKSADYIKYDAGQMICRTARVG
jgi:hypothetical protein